MNSLKLAVVGCGDIAGNTALVSRLISQITLSACCDVKTERLQSFAKQYNIPQVFRDYTDLLAKGSFDAVYLATPHYLHYEMILAALDAGTPVFVEKPLTRTYSEGMEIVKASANAKVGVNYQYRYDNACYALAQAIKSGSLGRIHSIRINLPWHRKQSYFDDAAWHKTLAQAGGGTLITQGSHFLDVVLWALGESPVSAAGYTATQIFNVEVETLAHGIVETSGGTLIGITSSMVAATEQAVTMEVYGEKGTAIYRNLPFPSLKFIGVKARKEKSPEWGIHALQRSLTGFANWVLNDKPFLTPASSTLPVLAAVDGIYRSAESGQRTRIDSITKSNPLVK